MKQAADCSNKGCEPIDDTVPLTVTLLTLGENESMFQAIKENENLRCIIFMIVAMAGFAVEDAVVKQLSFTMPISEILFLVGVGGLLSFGLLAKLQKVPLGNSEIKTKKFIARTFSELAAAIFFVSTIVYASLSISAAILQATPLVVALASAFFLKQRITLTQWGLIILGFFGVLMVMQPGLDGFQATSFFGVMAVLFLAMRDTITRSISLTIPAVTISFWSFFALCAAGLITAPFFDAFVMVTPIDLWVLSLGTFAGSIGYLAVVLATRSGDVAVVVPFRYTRLIFAFVIAVIVFDEPVGTLMLAGSTVIIVSGLLMLGLERAK